MAIVINGSGTVTGLAVGGLPDGTVDNDTVASGLASSKLTGALPAISGASLTGLNSSVTKVTKAYQSSTRSAFGYSRDLYASNLDFVGHKVAFSFTKDSASTDILVHFSMSVADFRDCWSTAIYTGSSGSASGMVRFGFAGREAIGDNLERAGVIVTGQVVLTGLGASTHNYYWAMGRKNDAYNTSYTLNPDTSDYAQYIGATTSTIMVYEGDFD